jgi:8-oxo-dGTP diphosphatase
VAELLLTTSHAYPDRTVTLFFYRCHLMGTPRPVLGQEMQWVSSEQLETLQFPPADAELIRLLTASDARSRHVTLTEAEGRLP